MEDNKRRHYVIRDIDLCGIIEDHELLPESKVVVDFFDNLFDGVRKVTVGDETKIVGIDGNIYVIITNIGSSENRENAEHNRDVIYESLVRVNYTRIMLIETLWKPIDELNLKNVRELIYVMLERYLQEELPPLNSIKSRPITRSLDRR